MKRIFSILTSILMAAAAGHSATVLTQRECSDRLQGSLAELRILATNSGDYDRFQARSTQQISEVFNLVRLEPSIRSTIAALMVNGAEPRFLRRTTLEMTGLWRNRQLLTVAEQRLSDGDPEIRRSAALGLGMSGLPEEYGPLSIAFGSESDPVNKVIILNALASIGNRAEWQRFIDDTERERPGSAALMQMGPLLDAGQESALKSLFSNALSNADYRVRMAAADAIGRRGYSDLVPLLLTRLDLEAPSTTFTLGGTPGLWMENKVVKIKILKALRELNATSAEAALISRFDAEFDQDVVAGYLDTFGAIGSPACHSKLLQSIQQDGEFWVMHAAMAAGRLRASAMLSALQARRDTVRDPLVKARLQEAIDEIR